MRLVRRRVLRIDSTAASGNIPPQHAIDDCGGAAHTCLYGYRSHGTVAAACPALHAGIPVPDLHVLAVHPQDLMGADIEAHPTADALGFIEPKGYDVFKIHEFLHVQPLHDESRNEPYCQA
jgi:hypothetical protein